MQKSALAQIIRQFLVSERTRVPGEQVSVVEAYRRSVRARWCDPVHQKCRDMRLAGKYPFEMGWHTRDEIVALKAVLLKRDRESIFDVVLIFGVGIAFDILLCAVIFWVIDAA